MPVTLILTRNPLKAFLHGGYQSGRFGELVAIKGPSVQAVQLLPRALAPSVFVQQQFSSVPVTHGVLQLTSMGEPIEEVKRFTSMERYKANNGRGYYVQLHPKKDPYSITFERGNSAVRKLRTGHDGRCFRVHGGKPGPEQGILIHEAPHVGYVIGCISPRPLGNFELDFKNEAGNPSYRAMNELISFVGESRAKFFVMDW